MAGTPRDKKLQEAREAREEAEDSLLSGGERVSKGRQRDDREESAGLLRRLLRRILP